MTVSLRDSKVVGILRYEAKIRVQAPFIVQDGCLVGMDSKRLKEWPLDPSS